MQDVDLNPKTISTEELYGYISIDTREWKDGLLSKIMRDLGAIPNEAPKWVVLDGDLDANWIESMNSVMDDNKVTCGMGYHDTALGVFSFIYPIPVQLTVDIVMRSVFHLPLFLPLRCSPWRLTSVFLFELICG